MATIGQESLGQSNDSVKIFPLGSKPFGSSYDDYITNYWKFILSIPEPHNPAEDQTGQNCTEGQNLTSSKIFYLHGNSGGKTEKTCIMPAGLGLFIPILQGEFSKAEVPGSTVDKLHELAQKDQDSVTSLSLTINGTQYQYADLVKYGVHTKEFQVYLPQDNILGVDAGDTIAVADGYQVITSPLSPGNYTIYFGGILPCLASDCEAPNFSTESIYHLIVR
jgi:hypothetical protein